MKKLNNKGFAISSLLYGLMLVAFLIVALIMSTMSTNRKNTSTLIKKIEEELNRYSQTTTELSSTDGAQEFIVPYGKSGWYKIELWGAAAENIEDIPETEEGRGSYTSGIIYLEENQHLYFFIGSEGGAGTPHNTYSSTAGGATDVRLIGGQWNDEEGKKSRLMIAAGGGTETAKGEGYGPDTLYATYNDGGSYISGMAGLEVYHDLEVDHDFTFLNTNLFFNVNSGKGKAKIELVSSTDKNNPPPTKITTLNNIKAVRDCIKLKSISATNKNSWKEIQILDKTGKNIANSTVNTDSKAYFGTKAQLNSGTGSQVPKIIDGDARTYEDTNTTITTTDTTCVEVQLGATSTAEEIVVFHGIDIGKAELINEEHIYVQKSDGSWIEVRGWDYSDGSKTSPHETRTGTRISDRNFYIKDEIKSTNVIPSGNYYIQPALSYNRVVSVAGGTGQIKMFSGANNEKWAIEQISGNIYKFIDSENKKALQPVEEGLAEGEAVNNSTEYKGHAWEQWQVIQAVNSPIAGNGFVMIKSNSGNNLCLATPEADRNKSAILKLEECDSLSRRHWFRLINADY